MLYTPHFLTGAAILKYLPNPYIGLPAAFLSHLILDMLPHNDLDLKPGITIKEFLRADRKWRHKVIAILVSDYILAFISFLWIWFTFKNYWLLLGGVVGVLPDAVEQLLMLFGVALPGWQDKFQFRVSAKYGFIYYPVVSLIATYFLIR